MVKLDDIFNSFSKIIEQPEDFLSPEDHHTELIKRLLKTTYDFTKEEEIKQRKISALPELIVDDFDVEQIWQQQELQNEGYLSKTLIDVSKFVVNKNSLMFDELKNEETNDVDESCSEKEEEADVNESDKEEPDDNLSENEDDENLKEDDFNKKRYKKSIVDDDFFKLGEMEEFLKNEEKRFEQENDEGDSGNDTESDEDDDKINDNEIDYFKADEIDDDEEDERLLNPRFKDFFRKQYDQNEFQGENDENFDENNDDFDENNENQNDFDENNENQNDFDKNNENQNDFDENNENQNDFDENNENQNDFDVENAENKNLKSTFELREERLKNKTNVIEEIALSKKPWPMLGEIAAENRPINSLLEEVVEFDVGTRPAPVITEKTSLQLDDIIKQRIKDKAFDSVERKEKLAETPFEYKKKLILDQEKSKESLAQIYEKEYLQQQESLNPNKDDEKEEEEPQLHKEVKTMMESLFKKLDALSNYHFTPKPAVPELKIVNNLPAINMEEVAPTATSDAKLLAPEEVKNRIKGDIIGKNERSDTDKNRERRKKKRKQQVHALRKEKKEALINKLNPGLGNKYSKEKAKKQLEKIVKDKNVDKMDESYGSKSVKSSTAFFNQLQDEVKSQIKNKVQMKKRKNLNNTGLSAKKMKL
ncbi:U3 small nucleolar ribonucleoprotein protein MPP10 [Onthophagus taurus]|uniref:U3 small nucleolar ribonucleoprotein protein MPP10 n=1 Tax=Onthophagus taurus TaxID=166361 RepID=UPI0039BE1084